FVLDLFREHKNDPTAQLVPLILSNVKLWGEDLTTINGFAEAVEGYLSEIRATGMYETLKTVI
ncbi:MAG: tagaturonate reductase, partial [Angelakisella sp.]